MAERLGKGGELEAQGALAGSIPGMRLAAAPAAGGRQGAELHPQGDAAKRVYLSGEGRNRFWQLFLGGRYGETTRSFADLSQLSWDAHKCMGCDCYFRAQKNVRYLAKDIVLPQQKHSDVV